ncbi:unnamed protein product [Orchesella dallaii]|uniref:Uncharacterized protein n=1 Tax=Orchesella dallaii TaxID=48710 RepID=A0ABP1PJV2_9HEXA
MWSTVTIINETNCILNVALKLATPLYYENKVMPGQSVVRKVGKVLFTLEAKLWNGENTYDEVRDIIAPLTMISSAALSGARGLAAMASGHAAEEMKNRQVFSMGKVLLPEGVSEETQTTIKTWITDAAVREHGYFMGTDRTIRIAGGPAACYDEENDTQFVETVEAFTFVY